MVLPTSSLQKKTQGISNQQTSHGICYFFSSPVIECHNLASFIFLPKFLGTKTFQQQSFHISLPNVRCVSFVADACRRWTFLAPIFFLRIPTLHSSFVGSNAVILLFRGSLSSSVTGEHWDLYIYIWIFRCVSERFPIKRRDVGITW